ncbi:MAG: hypothetical protein KDI83_13760 [Gammaproteobacteria bacterium]|nr:hypothetical protein [Gammaproteobacteria bacterium]
MKQPTFVEGVLVALIVAAGGTLLFNLAQLAYPINAILRLLIPLLNLCYLIYLSTRCRARLGRATTFAAWFLLSAAGLMLSLPLLALIALHTFFIWLVRSLYFHPGPFSAAVDLALTLCSLAASLWASLQSGNLFLSIWCFFLIQALFVLIPVEWPHKSQERNTEEERFYQAYQTAQKAFAKLITHK